MEPLPETREALAEFLMLDGPEPEELLDKLGRAARLLVPDLTALSLALTRDQLTFTLVASNSDAATLDASQYLAGGPCVDVGEGRSVTAVFRSDDPLDEERWHFFARATAARGVASTLSLPLYEQGVLIGSLNLYASSPDAFAGSVERLAELAGATPTEAIQNADLSFSTRLEAAAAPTRLRESSIIETAVGLIAGDRRIDLDGARQALHDAAARAGIHVARVAEVVVSVYARRQRD